MISGQWEHLGVRIVLRGAPPSIRTKEAFQRGARAARMFLDPVPVPFVAEIDEECSFEIRATTTTIGPAELAAALEMAADAILMPTTSLTADEMQSAGEDALDNVLNDLESYSAEELNAAVAARLEGALVRGRIPEEFLDLEVRPEWLRPGQDARPGDEHRAFRTAMAAAKKELVESGDFQIGDTMVYFHSGILKTNTLIRSVEGIAVVRDGKIVAYAISGFPRT